MSRPLAGISVLEVDDDLPIAFCGQALAALGARVVQLESPESGARRQEAPFESDGRSSLSVAVNSGKEQARFDRSGAGAEADLRRLAETFDVVVMSGPGASLGLRPKRVSARLESVVTRSDGHPGRVEPLTRLHASGSASLFPVSDPSTPPATPGRFAMDAMYGIALAGAITTALVSTAKQAAPGIVTSTTVRFSTKAYGAWLEKMFVHRVALDGLDLRRTNHGYSIGGYHKCRDGYICIAYTAEQHQWNNLVDMLGESAWHGDPRFADGVIRSKHAPEIQEMLARWCLSRRLDEVIAAARRHDVPAGRVASPREVLDTPGFRARRFIVGDGRGNVSIGLPFGPTWNGGAEASVVGHGLDGPPVGPADGDQRGYGGNETITDDPHETEFPLRGVRVLDLTWAAAGPTVTSFLADLGAEVVKIESASRPDLLRIANRSFGWSDDPSVETSGAFNEMAAGKKSILLDLRVPAGVEVARRLVGAADVFVENLRPGKIEALGMSYERLKELNPNLIMCSLSGTGHDGGEPLPGYAPVFWAEAGGAWFTGWPDDVPQYMRSPIDLHAGAFAFLGIAAMLYHQIQTRGGGYIDCSAIETVSWCFQDELRAAAGGLDGRTRAGNDRPNLAPHDVFPCDGDDEWIAIAVTNDEEYRSLCRVLGDSSLIEDDRFRTAEGRWQSRRELGERVAVITAKCSAHELEQRLVDAGVAAARSARLADLYRDPVLHEDHVWVRTVHPFIGEQDVVGLPYVIGNAPRHNGLSAPLLGADTASVLAEWIGVGREEYQHLMADGALA